MSGGAYRPHLPVRRPGGRPEQAPRYRVLLHRQFKHLWDALPDRVGLQRVQQFYDHVAHAPGSPAAINRTGVLRGKAGRPIAEGFSRTIHAERAVLTVEDLGRAYRAAPFTPSPTSADEDVRLNMCVGRPPMVQHETAGAFSPEFTMSDAQSILAGVTVVDTIGTAQADLAALADVGRAVPCLRKSLLRQYTGPGTPPTVDVSRTAQPPGGADVVAYRLRVIAGPPGSELPVILDVVSAVRGRAEVSITFRDVNQPVSADQQDRLVRAVLDRLAA